MGVVELGKEKFEKILIIEPTQYRDTFGKMVRVEPSKDSKKPTHLVVGEHLTIEIARKLVQAQKAAIVYPQGKKPKEV